MYNCLYDRGFGSIQILAENADSIVDLRGVGQDTARQLLREIMSRKKLTYPLAKVFMEAGDDELTRHVMFFYVLVFFLEGMYWYL